MHHMYKEITPPTFSLAFKCSDICADFVPNVEFNFLHSLGVSGRWLVCRDILYLALFQCIMFVVKIQRSSDYLLTSIGVSLLLKLQYFVSIYEIEVFLDISEGDFEP